MNTPGAHKNQAGIAISEKITEILFLNTDWDVKPGIAFDLGMGQVIPGETQFFVARL